MKIEIRAATRRDIEVITANNAPLAIETEHRRLSPDGVRAGVAAALADPVFRRLFDHLRTLARTEPGVCGLRLYVERDNSRAQQTYRESGLVEPGYLVMEDDFSDAVAHVGS